MTEIINSIQKIAIEISKAIKTKETEKVESQNASGDIQVKLDVISDEIVEKYLLKTISISFLFKPLIFFYL